MAQEVAHLIGSEEVTGPSPVSSLTEKIPEILSKYNRRLKLIPDKTPYFEYIPMKPAKDADELMENMRKVIEDIRSLKRS